MPGVKLQQIPGFSSGGGAVTGITFKDEGSVEGIDITSVNIVGTGHNVMLTGDGEVTIFSPEVDFVSHLNTTDGNNDTSISSINTTTRNISNPASEGSPFKIGDWTAGTTHAATQATIWSYSTNNQCLFEDLESTIEVQILDADGVSILESYTTPAIIGDVSLSQGNISVDITSWETDYIKYKAIIDVDIDIASIIPNGGRVSVRIIHHNGGTDYTKLQQGTFYDPDPIASSLTGVTIQETVGNVVTRFLSGTELYTTGSQFTVDIADIDNLNQHTYPTNQIEINGSEYGLPTLNITGAELTGWTNDYNDVDDTYQKTNWAINATNYCFIGTTANISARTIDWSSGLWVNSSNASVAINTRANSNTRLIERFDYEDWRCYLTDNFDTDVTPAWDSTIDVGSSDAVFRCGGCERNTWNWTQYLPNAVSQPNYSSGQDAEVFLVRKFQHDGSASSNFRINISGSYNSLEMKLAKAFDGSSSGGTVWVDCLADYNASEWNNGNPQSGTGCKTGSGVGYIDCTLGTNNIINTNNTIYIKVGFINSERITTLSVTFN